MVDDPPDDDAPAASGWQSPSGQPSGQEGAGQPPQAAQPGPPRYGEPGYQPPQYGQPQYEQPQYQQPQYGQPQYQQPQYQQPQYQQPPPPGYPGYGPPPGYGPAGPPPPGYAQAPPVTTWGPPPADKPGIIPLRPLATGEILDGVFAAIRQNPKAMLGLSFLIVLVGQIIVLAAELAWHDSGTGARAAASLVSAVVTFMTTTILTGAIVVVVSEAVLGTRITPSEVLDRLKGRVWGLIGLALLVGLLTLLATIALIIPGIYVAVLLSFATPVFVLERTRAGEALSRSSELVKGNWWRTLGIGILGYLVGGILSALVQLPFTIGVASSSGLFSTPNADISTGSELLLAVGRLIGGTISTPIIAGTIALLYVDRRIRREGLDLVLAQTARERQGRS